MPPTGGLQRSDSDGEEDPGAGEEAPELGRGAGWRRKQVVAALMEVAVSLGLGVHSVRLGLVITQVSLGLGHVADSWV